MFRRPGLIKQIDKLEMKTPCLLSCEINVKSVIKDITARNRKIQFYAHSFKETKFEIAFL